MSADLLSCFGAFDPAAAGSGTERLSEIACTMGTVSDVDAAVADHRKTFGVAAPPDPKPVRYPYLVIRSMAAVYGTAEIRIIPHDDDAPVGRGLKVVIEHYRDGGELDTTTRRRIIDAALAKSKCDGRQFMRDVRA